LNLMSAQAINPLKALISRHCATLVGRVGALGAIVQALPDASDRQVQIAEGRALAHQITGSSGSIGFDDLSTLAAALESKFVELQRPGQSADRMRLVEVASLYRKLESAAQATSPEHSRLFDTDIHKLGRAQT
jgi:HPt (histidine-containing phosphotransfer) domain-containing protein